MIYQVFKNKKYIFLVGCLFFIGMLLLYPSNKVQAESEIRLNASIADYNTVLLEWESPSTDYQYEIQKSRQKNGEYVTMANLSGQSGRVACYDYDVQMGKVYYYRVITALNGQTIGQSESISVRIELPAPKNVKVKKVKGSKVKLSWTEVEKAVGYTIYRSSEANDGYKKIGTSFENSYTDSDVSKGQIYYYRIAANRKKSCPGEKSENVCAYMKPAPPEVNGSYTKKRVIITWNKVEDAQKYLIYKKNQDGKYILVKETSGLKYSDKKVKKGERYFYKIVAVCEKDAKQVKTDGGFCDLLTSDIDPKKKMVALTFDDGPGPYTKEIVACLKKNNAKATFFVLGCNVNSYKDALKEASKAGCEIGNHSFSHPNLANLSEKEIKKQMSDTDKKIKDITGQSATVMRPPGGSVSQSVRENVNKPIILWSIDTLDWKHRNTQKTIDAVLSQVKDGDIVLMHDIHKPTKEAACSLIVTLRRQGYQLVTVSELAQYRGVKMKKGTTYYSIKKGK